MTNKTKLTFIDIKIVLVFCFCLIDINNKTIFEISASAIEPHAPVDVQVSIIKQQQQQQKQVSLSANKFNINFKEQQNDNNSTETKFVFPANDTDINSQIVYVNLGKLINSELAGQDATPSSGNSTNNVSRVVGNDSQQQKVEATIVCGETNKNGVSSLDPKSPQIVNRIVGGGRAEPGEFPFQVRLNIRSRRGSSLCGGVLIDKRHILTAAHCVTTCSSYFVSTNTVEPTKVKATIGDYKIASDDGEQVVSIESVKAHERYSACSYSHNNYDLAILKTATPISWAFTSDGFGSVNRICLPKASAEYNVGDNVTVSGWGVEREGEGLISNTLNSVTVPIVSLDECKNTYGQRVNKDHVCAGYSEGGRDSCQGDSGGPLIRHVNGLSELVGIVSFGYGCAQKATPGVYTRVANFLPWIKANL